MATPSINLLGDPPDLIHGTDEFLLVGVRLLVCADALFDAFDDFLSQRLQRADLIV